VDPIHILGGGIRVGKVGRALMPTMSFPDSVEDFIKWMDTYLSKFKLKLRIRDEVEAIESRWYEVDALDGSVTVNVHRINRSFKEPVGRYRVRVIAKTDPSFGDYVLGKEDRVNMVATLGAMATTENAVVCQSLIPLRFAHTTAALTAVAVAHARRSLMVSVAKVLTRPDENPIERLSAWGDLDFETLNYDYAHLGLGSLGRRSWRIGYGAMRLYMDAVHNNPYWGGGLLCLLRISKSSLLEVRKNLEASELNKWAFLIGDAPTFGAWCAEGDDFVFVQFFPNWVKELPGLMDLIVEHARLRAAEIRLLVEASQSRGQTSGSSPGAPSE
jgi:hypothetical protein